MPETSSLPPFNIPIPDPSVITEREIAKAKSELRREFEILLDGLTKTLSATREGYVHLFEARLDGAVQRLDEKISAVLIKFEGVDHRLVERDRRFDSAILSHKDAANASIVATAAALVKTEASFTKEIDAIKTLIEAMKEGFHADLGNLKGRMDRGEGGTQGARTQVEDHRANTALTTTIIGGIVGFLVLIIAFAGLWISAHPNRQSPEIVSFGQGPSQRQGPTQ